MKARALPGLCGLIIFCAALCVGSGALAAVPEYDIKAACAEVAAAGGGSKVIELECRKQENAARKRLEKKPLPQDVLARCDEIARATGAGSYIILEECARQEQVAAAQLD